MAKINEELELWTLEETATFLKVSRRTLHRLIHGGKIGAFKIGGQWRFIKTHLVAHIMKLSQGRK